jgi:hypothetical protein
LQSEQALDGFEVIAAGGGKGTGRARAAATHPVLAIYGAHHWRAGPGSRPFAGLTSNPLPGRE